MLLEAYTLTGSAIIILTFILSGFQKIQDLGLKIARIPIRFGRFKVALHRICCLICSIGVTFSILKLWTVRSNETEVANLSIEQRQIVADQVHGTRWRHERNLYIRLCAIALWAIISRASSLFCYFAKRIEDEELLASQESMEEKSKIREPVVETSSALETKNDSENGIELRKRNVK